MLECRVKKVGTNIITGFTICTLRSSFHKTHSSAIPLVCLTIIGRLALIETDERKKLNEKKID